MHILEKKKIKNQFAVTISRSQKKNFKLKEINKTENINGDQGRAGLKCQAKELGFNSAGDGKLLEM